MSTPWNEMHSSTPPGNKPSSTDAPESLQDWMPLSAHPVDSLNQFAFENVDPLALRRDDPKSVSLSTLSLSDNDSKHKQNPFDLFVETQKDDRSYDYPDLNETQYGPASSASVSYPDQSQSNQSAPPLPLYPPLSPTEQCPHQQWQHHSDATPSKLIHVLRSVDSTPVTSPMASPRDMAWPLNMSLSGYFDSSFAKHASTDHASTQHKSDDQLSFVGPSAPPSTSSTMTHQDQDDDDTPNHGAGASGNGFSSDGGSSSRSGSNTNDANDKTNSKSSRGTGSKLSKQDKRQRNTAASARFRIKKKQRMMELQRTAYEMTEKSRRLEAHVQELQKEIKWLKALIVEKNEARSQSHSGRSVGNNNLGNPPLL